MRFFNFFLTYMVQKYQNEISPIFYYGKSAKTNEKDLKILNLQPIDWGQPYWMTRYIVCWPLMKADVNSSLILHNCFQKFCFWNLIWCSFPMVKEWFIYLMIILLLLTKIFKIIFTSSYFFNFNIFYIFNT